MLSPWNEEIYFAAMNLCTETSGGDTLDLVNMEWLTDYERAEFIASKYAKSLTGGNTFTDKYKKKHEFVMTEEQTQEYLDTFDSWYWSAYSSMITGWQYQNATPEKRADMIDDLKSDVCNDVKKYFSKYLPTLGNNSIPKQ